MTTKTTLIQGIDYTINSEGLLVFTEKYHLDRGYCCQSGCVNCPYGYKDKIDPSIPAEFQSNWSDEGLTEDDSEEE